MRKGFAQSGRDFTAWLTGTASTIARDVRNFTVDEVVPFLTSPSHVRRKFSMWEQRRADAQAAARLNRQIRDLFVESLHRSNLKKLSVETNDLIDRYKSVRNEHGSYYSRLWRMNMRQNPFLRIGTTVGFFIGARALLAPLMGWASLTVPMITLMVARFSEVHLNRKTLQLEKQLGAQGILVPVRAQVQEATARYAGQVLDDNALVSFPVLNATQPRWMISVYDAEGKTLSGEREIHAAGFEALKRGMLTLEQVEEIEARFGPDRSSPVFVYGCSLLFPDKNLNDLMGLAETLCGQETDIAAFDYADDLSGIFGRSLKGMDTTRKGPFTKAIVHVLNDFCLRDNLDFKALSGVAGLSALAGKVSIEDLQYIADLRAAGFRVGAEQAQEIFECLDDSRFWNESDPRMSFAEIVELSFLDDDRKKLFNDFWKNQNFTGRFNYADMKEMVLGYHDRGRVALSIAQHSYAKNLSYAEIKDLAASENENWAPTYHKLRLDYPEAQEIVTHDDLKTITQAMGLTSETSVVCMMAGAGDAATAMAAARLIHRGVEEVVQKKSMTADWQQKMSAARQAAFSIRQLVSDHRQSFEQAITCVLDALPTALGPETLDITGKFQKAHGLPSVARAVSPATGYIGGQMGFAP